MEKILQVHEECIRVAEEALRLGAERRYDILDTLGLAYGRLRDYPQARSYMAEALEKVPPHAADAVAGPEDGVRVCPVFS